MEKIYAKDQDRCKLTKAKPQTVRFLLDYSKSLKITEVQGFKFESNIN